MSQCSTEEIEDLLQITRLTLMERVLPVLDEEGRYVVRMAINAIRIAARSLDAREPRQSLLVALRELYPDADSGSAQHAAQLLRRFATDIRTGRFDSGDLDETVRRLLRDDVERRLEISNPKYLRSLHGNS